jgi:CheY-like chemotaxis protein
LVCARIYFRQVKKDEETLSGLRQLGHGQVLAMVYAGTGSKISHRVFLMPRAKRTSRILLVNGDATVQHLRALMLRMERYEVDIAADLQAAQAAAALLKYDLIIVDVGHFAQPGLDFCEEVKKKYPGQKVLMQADAHLYLEHESCPDKVVAKQDGPHHFVSEVEQMLQA